MKDQKKFDAAIAEDQEALRVMPDLTEVHFDLGEILRSQGKWSEATKEFREFLRLTTPDSSNQERIDRVRAFLVAPQII